MSRFDAEDEITLTFDQARAALLTVLDARDAAPEGSELQLRLAAVARVITSKLFPDFPE